MSNKVELAEYGLQIREERLVTNKCPKCEREMQLWLDRDWVVCKECESGYSRLELLPPSELGNILMNFPEAEEYWLKDVCPRRNLAELWYKLSPLLGSVPWLSAIGGDCLGKHIRLLGNHRDLAHLLAMLPEEERPVVNCDFPTIVMRLDNLPGRMSGMALCPTNKNGVARPVIMIPVIPGNHFGFLSCKTPSASAVLMDSFTDVILAHAAREKSRNAYHPILFCNNIRRIDARQAAPFVSRTTSVIATRAYDYASILKGLDTEYRLYKMRDSDKYLRGLGPGSTLFSEWHRRVFADSVAWWQAVVELVEGAARPIDAVAFIQKLSLTPEQLQMVLELCSPDFVKLYESSSKKVPISFTHSTKGVVLDDGTSWKTSSGNNILSVSFRIRQVERGNKSKIVYRCSLVSESEEIQFSAGKELERNAFDVILREGMLRGWAIQVDRNYHKYVVEIAAGLRPLRKSTLLPLPA
jgi:hypothetical protein